MSFFSKLFSRLFKKLEQKVYPQPVTQPAPVQEPNDKLGTTDPSWVAPPKPWPIDARYLSAEQVAKLTQEETGRANMWQQALMTAALTGNGQNPVPAALGIYKSGYTKSEDLNKPISGIWVDIYKAYGVEIPGLKKPHINLPPVGYELKKNPYGDGAEWPVAAPDEPDPASMWRYSGDLGYQTRDEMYAKRSAWMYAREQKTDTGGHPKTWGPDNPYVTVENDPNKGH